MSEEPIFYDGGRVDLLDCNNDIPKIKNKAEALYIKKRKIKAMLESICFYICRIFPIKKNLISVCTFEGKGGFGCNPKYLVQELHKRNADYRFVWFVNDMTKIFPEYIKKVPNTVWSRAYWLSTSKLWIDNYRKPYGTVKRKGQFYINTWHGTIGFKSTGKLRGKAFSRMAYLVSKNDSDMVDRFIIDSEWCKEITPKGLLYEGECLNSGAPRCDILYGDREIWKDRYRKNRKIPKTAKIVMYAPTFRESSYDGKREIGEGSWAIDFNRLMKVLSKRFGGEWYVCLRVHPQLAGKVKINASDYSDHVIDDSDADDMYEILAAMDIFITDYSSAAMDASFCHMPVFIFADDIEEYTKDRGSLLWELTTDATDELRNNKEMTPDIDVVLPYSIAKDNNELENNIINFDTNDYLSKMTDFEKAVGLVFDGNASSKVSTHIIEYLNK